MPRWSRRHLLASCLGWTVTGCHLVRFTPTDKNGTPSVADALKSAKPSGNPLDGPRRVGLKIATLSTDLKNPAIDEAIWRTTDEQVISQELRDSLRNNGLRVGLLRSALPAEVEELLEHGGPSGQRVEPLALNQPVNEPTKIAMGEKSAEVSMLLDISGKIQGKTYKDVAGYLRLTTSMDDQKGVVLKVMPELHHGDPKLRLASVGEAVNPFEPAQMSMKTLQEEELFRDLAASVRLEQGQCLVIGLDSARQGGLGWFLMTSPPAEGKETQQKLILVWAWNAGREASLEVPQLVQANSRQIKKFQPLQSPSPEMLAKRETPSKLGKRDDQVQAAGFSEKNPKQAAKTGGTTDSKTSDKGKTVNPGDS